MLYDCDALLPQAERYASGKYRRLSRALRVADMDYGDALELAAFMGVVGHEVATYLFKWNKRTARETLRLTGWMDAWPYIVANHESVEEADGLALMQALVEHGWNRRTQYLPSLVAKSLKAGWKRGESVPEQAKKWPLTPAQIQRLRSPRRKVADKRRAAEFASLGLVFV